MRLHLKYNFILLTLFAAGLLFSCEEEEKNGPEPTAALEVAPESALQVNKEITFVSTSKNATSFLWSFGDGNTAIGKQVSHVYNKPGDYTVTIEASGNGMRDVASQTITIEASNYELYFIDNDAMKLRKISLKDPSQVTDVFDLPGFCMGLAWDAATGEFYYSDDDAKKIYKNNLAGTAETEVAADLADPRDIALDLENDRLFVAERGADQITEVDLSDNSKSALYSSADDPLFLLPVGLDIHDGYLYATAVEIDAETVWKGKTDGSGITKIINYSNGGYGYGLEVDKENDKIYFDDTDTGSILMADLDGSNVETAGTASDRCYAIAIENEGGKVYWATRDGIIKEANLDGTEEAVVRDLAVDIRGMVIVKGN